MSFLFRKPTQTETKKEKHVIRFSRNVNEPMTIKPVEKKEPISPRNVIFNVLGGRKNSQQPNEWYDNGVDPTQFYNSTPNSGNAGANTAGPEHNTVIGAEELRRIHTENANNSNNNLAGSSMPGSPQQQFRGAGDAGSHARKVSNNIDLSNPYPLREQMRLFYEKHDKGKLQNGGLDNFIAFVQKNGIDSFNAALVSKYGESLEDVVRQDKEQQRKDENSAQKKSEEATTPSSSEKEIPNASHNNNNNNNHNNNNNNNNDEEGDFVGNLANVTDKMKQSQHVTQHLSSLMVPESQSSFIETGYSSRTLPMFNESAKLAAMKKELELEKEKEEEQNQACDHYKVDATKPFGICKCGYSRADHKHRGNAAAAASLPTTDSSSSSSNNISLLNIVPTASPSNTKHSSGARQPTISSVMTREESAKWSSNRQLNLEINTTAKEEEEEEHSNNNEKALGVTPLFSPIHKAVPMNNFQSPKVQAGRKRAGSKSDPVTGKVTTTSEACNTYSLDMKGATFGVCVCGFPRADHNKVKPAVSKTLEKKWASKKVT